MGNLNIVVSLQAYQDTFAPTNNPTKNFFRWTRSLAAIPIEKAISYDFSLSPGESRTIFNGTRTLLQDTSTQYQIGLVAGTTNTYFLQAVGGTLPNFRTPRITGADASTQVTVTRSGFVSTFASTGGTPFSFVSGGVVVGDTVFIGTPFNISNQGYYTVIGVTATSISLQNDTGIAEGPLTLGSTFATNFQIYSTAGVQVNDVLNIFGGFSPASFGPYPISQVQANYLTFYSGNALPAQTVTTDSLVIYSDAKSLIYLESDQITALTINGVQEASLEPFIINNDVCPGMLLKRATIWSMEIQNTSTNEAYYYYAAVE